MVVVSFKSAPCLCENRIGAKLSPLACRAVRWCCTYQCGARRSNGICLFCGAAIALARMRNYVGVHLHDGEVVTDPRMRGEAEPCGLCGCSTGMCTTSIVRKKISSTCPCVDTLKHAVAMHKQENMPRECPIL